MGGDVMEKLIEMVNAALSDGKITIRQKRTE